MVTFGNGSGKTSLSALASKPPEPKPLRGAMRFLESLGHGALTEFPLKSGRRAGFVSLGAKGEIWVVEVDRYERRCLLRSRIGRKRPSGMTAGEAIKRIRYQAFGTFEPAINGRTIPDVRPVLFCGWSRFSLGDPSRTRRPSHLGRIRGHPGPGTWRKALTLRFANIAAARLPGHEGRLWDDCCLEPFVFAEFFQKTGRAIRIFMGQAFWELCLDADYFGARLARMRCNVRRCMCSRLAVSDTFRLQSS